MAGSHLGWRAGALSDGELTSSELARAWAHYRTCGWCREQVDGQREIRAHMGKATGVHIPPDVLSELYATPRWAALPKSVHARGEVAVRRGPPPRRRDRSTAKVGRVAVAAFSLLVIGGLSTAYVIGDSPVPPRGVVTAARQSAALNAAQEAANSRHPAHHAREETDAALAWMASAGWSVPSSLPDGYYFTSFEYSTVEDESLQVMIATPTGSVSLTVIHDSRIDPAHIGDLEERVIGGWPVYCQEIEGQLAGAMDSGGELLVFVSNASEADLAAILANSPGPEPNTAAARITRGLRHLISAP